ncbi:hypothetical protein [Polyangium mundeleinium]|uniref:Uncharacterized protein n=1 Tax=Polyangium mundeleinium TaxID=2995306 RepID=A0ABT5EU04_9BACT|nr:hypothetical protein [Polyangium mundeleinium]MDC0744280.1 hypothetical protein [Polyangium mundeleinium]
MRIQGGAAHPSYGPNRQFVRLGLRDEHKRLGIGEASPLPPFAADVASVLAVILGEALPNLATIRDDLPPREAVAAAMAPVERALAPYPAARFARRPPSSTSWACAVASPSLPASPARIAWPPCPRTPCSTLRRPTSSSAPGGSPKPASTP